MHELNYPIPVNAEYPTWLEWSCQTVWLWVRQEPWVEHLCAHLHQGWYASNRFCDKEELQVVQFCLLFFYIEEEIELNIASRAILSSLFVLKKRQSNNLNLFFRVD